MPEIVVLILLMIIGALVAIETPNLLYSVISIGAVGFLLSIIFLFLSAPDLAITQIAVEVITLVILLRAVARAKRDVVSDHRKSLGMMVTVAMVLVLAIFGVYAMFTIWMERKVSAHMQSRLGPMRTTRLRFFAALSAR